MKEDITSLAHTKWRCQYHLVFAPKYRRQIIYGKYRKEIGKILRKICERIVCQISFVLCHINSKKSSNNFRVVRRFFIFQTTFISFLYRFYTDLSGLNLAARFRIGRSILVLLSIL